MVAMLRGRLSRWSDILSSQREHYQRNGTFCRLDGSHWVGRGVIVCRILPQLFNGEGAAHGRGNAVRRGNYKGLGGFDSRILTHVRSVNFARV